VSMILTKEQILALIPQQNPFRFIDELELVDSESCRGNYLFKSDEYFYEGHFPEKPITPGVIVTGSDRSDSFGYLFIGRKRRKPKT
jgi:3-hydroxymyristoyl/3-hydroxydecanoyl-(acyl carrier protein) dehydratase